MNKTEIQSANQNFGWIFKFTCTYVYNKVVSKNKEEKRDKRRRDMTIYSFRPNTATQTRLRSMLRPLKSVSRPIVLTRAPTFLAGGLGERNDEERVSSFTRLQGDMDTLADELEHALADDTALDLDLGLDGLSAGIRTGPVQCEAAAPAQFELEFTAPFNAGAGTETLDGGTYVRTFIGR